MTDREQLLLELEQAPESVIDQVRHLLQQIRQPGWRDERPSLGDNRSATMDAALVEGVELPPAILELRRLRKLGKPLPEDFDPDAVKWAYLREKHNL
jgi:hypothetical protein